MITRKISEAEFDRAIAAEVAENEALMRTIHKAMCERMATMYQDDNLPEYTTEWAQTYFLSYNSNTPSKAIDTVLNRLLTTLNDDHNPWRAITLFLIVADIDPNVAYHNPSIQSLAKNKHKSKLLQAIHESEHLKVILQYRANPTLIEPKNLLSFNFTALHCALSLNANWDNQYNAHNRATNPNFTKRSNSVRELCYLMGWTRTSFDPKCDNAIIALARSSEPLSTKMQSLPDKKTALIELLKVATENKTLGNFWLEVDLLAALLAHIKISEFRLPTNYYYKDWLTRRYSKTYLLFAVKYNADYFKPLLQNKDTLLDKIIDHKKGHSLLFSTPSKSRAKLTALLDGAEAKPQAPMPQ